MESMTDEQKKRFYESAKAEAKDKWEKDPQDSAALTRWGGALLELANFSPGEDAAVMVEEAVDKFKMALKIDPRKHEASWCLGNAYTSQAFLSEEKSVAAGLFSKAKVRALQILHVYNSSRTLLQQCPRHIVYERTLLLSV
jgi:tetratricopeptide (TPR) repeat protein